MELLVVFGGMGGMAALMVLGVLFMPEDLQAKRALWAQIASEYGGTHEVGRNAKSFAADRLVISLANGDVTLAEGKVPGTRGAVLIVRATLRSPLPVFRVVPERVLDVRTRTERGKSVAIDGKANADFDVHFVATGDAPALVRRVWSPELATRIASSDFLPHEIRSTGRELVVLVQLWGREDERLRTSIELVRALATRDVYGTGTLRELGGALRVSDDGVPSATVEHPCPVRVTAEVHDDRLCTVAHLLERLPTGTREMALGLPRDAACPELRALPLRSAPLLSQVGTGSLHVTGDRRARVQFDDIVEAPERLRAAAALLNALRLGPEEAVYR